MHPFAMHRFQRCKASLKSLWYILTHLRTVSSSQVRWSTRMLNSLPVHKYAACFAIRNRRARCYSTSCSHNQTAASTNHMHQQTPLFNQVRFIVLHLLLNSSPLLNSVQSYHPRSREYIDMQPFAMHYFQGCRGSLKRLSKILRVSCPPLLHWCS